MQDMILRNENFLDHCAIKCCLPPQTKSDKRNLRRKFQILTHVIFHGFVKMLSEISHELLKSLKACKYWSPRKNRIKLTNSFVKYYFLRKNFRSLWENTKYHTSSIIRYARLQATAWN